MEDASDSASAKEIFDEHPQRVEDQLRSGSISEEKQAPLVDFSSCSNSNNNDNFTGGPALRGSVGDDSTSGTRSSAHSPSYENVHKSSHSEMLRLLLDLKADVNALPLGEGELAGVLHKINHLQQHMEASTIADSPALSSSSEHERQKQVEKEDIDEEEDAVVVSGSCNLGASAQLLLSPAESSDRINSSANPNGSSNTDCDSNRNSSPKLAVLPDEALRCIAQFADMPAVNKLFNDTAHTVAEENIGKIASQFFAGEEMEWKIRLVTKGIERIKSYYEHAATLPPPEVFPTVQPRFLWHSGLVREHPLYCTYDEIPMQAAAMLPNGPNGREISFLDIRDRFGIFNIRTGEIDRGHSLLSSLPPSIDRGCYFRNLYCTKAEKSGNDFLAVTRMNFGVYFVWIWSLNKDDNGDSQIGPFVREVRPSSSGKWVSCAVSLDGVVSFVAHDSQDKQCILIELYDIESGGQILERTIRVRGKHVCKKVCLELAVGFASGSNNIIIERSYSGVCPHSPPDEIKPDAGMGIYCLDRKRPHAQASYFPCLEQNRINWTCWSTAVMVGQQLLIVYKQIVFGTLCLRAVSFCGDGVGEMKLIPELVPLRKRYEVVLVTPTSVFTIVRPDDDDDDDGECQIDEFNIASGEKVRTLFTGLGRSVYSWNYAVATDAVLICTFYNIGEHVVQTFLL